MNYVMQKKISKSLAFRKKKRKIKIRQSPKAIIAMSVRGFSCWPLKLQTQTSVFTASVSLLKLSVKGKKVFLY